MSLQLMALPLSYTPSSCITSFEQSLITASRALEASDKNHAVCRPIDVQRGTNEEHYVFLSPGCSVTTLIYVQEALCLHRWVKQLANYLEQVPLHPSLMFTNVLWVVWVPCTYPATGPIHPAPRVSTISTVAYLSPLSFHEFNFHVPFPLLLCSHLFSIY